MTWSWTQQFSISGAILDTLHELSWQFPSSVRALTESETHPQALSIWATNHSASGGTGPVWPWTTLRGTCSSAGDSGRAECPTQDSMLGGTSSYFAQVIPLHLDYLRNGRDSPGSSGDMGLIPGWRTKIPHTVEELSPCAITKTWCSQIKKKKKRKKWKKHTP